MLILLTLLLLWAIICLILLWLGTSTPRVGSRRLVRTCDRRVVHVNDEVTVRLWPHVGDLPLAVSNPTPMRVVIALDHSSSMSDGPGSALARAIAAAASFVNATVSDRCHIGVVQFDGQARVAHPVSNSRDSLLAAVRGISPGGQTDIAGGLRLARQALRDASGAGATPERVVILLSDGRSDEAVAVREADALKADGVRVIAIALGPQLHEPLLRKLASGPADYYHTLDITELTRLYETVRLSLAEPRGFRAVVDESVSPPFVLSASGDVAPFEMRFGDGTARWFLPFVPERRDIAYQIVPTRAGWHRIARRPATLEVIDKDGLPHRGESNASPWLLVLPEWCPTVFAWFFGPLLWIAWQLVARRRVKPFRLVEEPERIDIRMPDAAPVQVPLARRSQNTLPPTLIVGVGYTGAAVLRALRMQLASLSPPPLSAPPIQYLWVDTGVVSDDDFKSSAVLGEPIAERDRVLMPENVYGLFEAARRGPQSPRLAWLDADALRAGLGPDDYRLTRGTRRRRALARAALIQHLEAGDRAPLSVAIDERLRPLGQHARVVLVGHASGGTGGGMTIDLAIWIRKRARAIDVDLRSLDLVLMTHRALDASRADDVYARNAVAFASELSRAIVRPVPLRIAQTPLEEAAPAAVSNLVDRVIVLEQPIESGESRNTWPAAAAHNGTEVLLHLLLYPSAGAMQLLDGFQDRAREETRRTGQAIVCAAGATSRWIPIAQVKRYLLNLTVREFLARDLLLLERNSDGLTPMRLPDLERIQRALVSQLCAGDGLSRPAPAFLNSLPALSDAETSGRELAVLLEGLQVWPTTTGIATTVVSEQVLAEVLATHETRLGDLLEEWALATLNGAPDIEHDFDPDVRKASLWKLCAAMDRLSAAVDACVTNLSGLEDSVRQRGHGARFEFVRFAFRRYRAVISALRQHLADWERTLVAAAVQADRIASSAQRELAELSATLRPNVVWADQIERELTTQYVEPTRADLLRQASWSTRPGAGGAFHVELRVGGPDAPLTAHPGKETAGGAFVHATLERTALHLRLSGLDGESLQRWMRLSPWLAFDRLDPCAFDSAAGPPGAAIRRDFAMVPDGLATSDAPAVDVLPTDYPYRASIVRMMPGCQLASIAAFGDYERRVAGAERATLPFLDPIDRLAAQHEDQFVRLGIPPGGLCPAIRACFHDRERFRTFALAYAFDLLTLEPTRNGDALFLSNAPLAAVDRDASYAALLQALDNYVMRGQDIDGVPVDGVAQSTLVGSALVAASTDTLKQTSRALEDRSTPWLRSCPPVIRADFMRVTRLFLEIEAERRELSAAGGRSL